MSMWLSISFNAFTVLLWILSHVFLHVLFYSVVFPSFLDGVFFSFFLFCIMVFLVYFLYGYQTVAKSKWLYFALYINNICQPFWYCRKGKKGIYMLKKQKKTSNESKKKRKCIKKKKKRFIGKGNKVLWIGTPFIYTKIYICIYL